MKKYAFIDYGGQVLSIETRCACVKKSDKKGDELSVEDIVHPDFVGRFVEIPEGTTVSVGMIYSDGAFVDSPLTSPLESRLSAAEDAILALMLQ